MQKLKVYKINVFFSTLLSLIIYKFGFYKIVFFLGLLYEMLEKTSA